MIFRLFASGQPYGGGAVETNADESAGAGADPFEEDGDFPIHELAHKMGIPVVLCGEASVSMQKRRLYPCQ